MHHLFPRSVPSPRLRFVGGLVRSRRAGPRLVLPALPRRLWLGLLPLLLVVLAGLASWQLDAAVLRYRY